jgi:hypothetical protein
MSNGERLLAFRGNACRVANRIDPFPGAWLPEPLRQALAAISPADLRDLPASYLGIVQPLKAVLRVVKGLANSPPTREDMQELLDAARRIRETVREIEKNEEDERLEALSRAGDSTPAAAIAPAPAAPSALASEPLHTAPEANAQAPTGAGPPREAPPADGDLLAERPRWDGARRQLWWGTTLLRTYTRHAPAQFAVLDAFERAGWPTSIPNPLTHFRPKDAVDSLNGGLTATRLRFQIGQSEGQTCIRWSLTV